MAQWDSGNTGPAQPPAPPGWYRVDGEIQRYWDGSAWTEHTAPLAPPPSIPPPFTPSPPTAPAPENAPRPWVDGAPAEAAANMPGMPPFQTNRQPFVSPGGVHGVPGGSASAPAYRGPVSNDERTMALLMHLLSLISGFLGPLVLWLVKREESVFLNHHGKEAINFQISLMLYWVFTVIAMFFLIGILLVPVLVLLGFVLPIVAAVAGNRGEYYRYPLTLRIIP